MLAEFRSNFPFYAPRALAIRTKSGAVEPFRLNRAQLYLHQRLAEQEDRLGFIRALVLKGRQQGVSTYVQGRYYWRTSMHRGKRAFILTHEDAATANLFDMAARYHENCPSALRPHTGASNAKELVFDLLDSGYKVATAGTKNVGRSATAQLFHGSEVGFWPHAKDHLAGIGQTIPTLPGTEIILESTANGPTGEFYSMWSDAERGRSVYLPVFIPWFWQDEYSAGTESLDLSIEDAEYQAIYELTDGQMAWRQQKVRDDFRGDVSLFNQEYPATPALAFLRIDGSTLIGAMVVAAAKRPRQNIEALGPKIIGVDPAEYGDDDSACIFRQGRRAYGLQRWHGLAPMETVGKVAMAIDREGGVDAVCVDATGIGSGICDRLRELGYPVVRVMAGASASDDEKYARLGDEIWGRMRDWLEDAPSEIPENPVLEGDLVSRTYSYDSSRRIKLTPKERLKADGKKSPDCGDALAMTFAATFAAGFGSKLIDHKRQHRGGGRVI
jgi:hypothetical protein